MHFCYSAPHCCVSNTICLALILHSAAFSNFNWKKNRVTPGIQNKIVMTELLQQGQVPSQSQSIHSARSELVCLVVDDFLHLIHLHEEFGPTPLCRGVADSSSPERCGAWAEQVSQWSIKRLIATAVLDCLKCHRRHMLNVSAGCCSGTQEIPYLCIYVLSPSACFSLKPKTSVHPISQKCSYFTVAKCKNFLR